MKLIEFSVENFRSIRSAQKFKVFGRTVLVGKNNEGKSNVLHALSMAMKAIESHGSPTYHPSYRQRYIGYRWERDFPISLQNSKKNDKKTILRLGFELDEEEVLEFTTKIGSNLNGTLPFEIVFGEKNRPEAIRVKKTGRGHATLNRKSPAITEYVASRISLNYIPAIRTHDQALEVVQDLVASRLKNLETNSAYQKALQTIEKLQVPELEKLEGEVKEHLSEFLPSIKKVEILSSNLVRYRRSISGFDVIIDDGTPTSIENKGDGVKSLATLALLKNQGATALTSIIAMEEPESHLHPGAIHQIQEIIESLSDQGRQIVLTTHNPLLVDRANVEANVIVDKGKVKVAKNISEVREVLGIRVSDNLTNSRFVLVVEGNEDKLALEALLPELSSKLKKALTMRLLTIDSLGGASKLSYKIHILRSQLCVYHVLLDNDQAGRRAFEVAETEGSVQDSQVTFTNCAGMSDSEFEDCLKPELYRERILASFGVDLSLNHSRSSDIWNLRMKAAFVTQGKQWNERVKGDLKRVVAQAVANNPKDALLEQKRSSIDALVNALERMIEQKEIG